MYNHLHNLERFYDGIPWGEREGYNTLQCVTAEYNSTVSYKKKIWRERERERVTLDHTVCVCACALGGERGLQYVTTRDTRVSTHMTKEAHKYVKRDPHTYEKRHTYSDRP